MAARRTAWHFFFGMLLRTRGAPGFEVQDEVPLAEEPPRMDYLLLRRTGAVASDEPGQTLRGLWPCLSRATVLELKSISHPYRTGDLDRLWGYVHLYHAGEHRDLPSRADLRATLVVPARTPTLRADVDGMGLRWEDLGGGYWRVAGGIFSLFVVEIDVAAEREDDDILRLFSHQPERTLEARRFWAKLVGTKEAKMAVQDLEGYDEVIQKFLEDTLTGVPDETLQRLLDTLTPEQRLAGVPPEQRVAGVPPEQRLAGLSPEQVLLALPDAVLRGLSEDYLAALPEPVRAAIRRRLHG